MNIRDRVRELRRVRAGDLRPNPRNWRVHPPAQQDALRGVLAEVGFASALVARELADGTLELIDGHLRAETTPDMLVPVLVLDVDAGEADKLLAALDPLSAMATTDPRALESLLADVQTSNASLQSLFDDLKQRAQHLPDTADEPRTEDPPADATASEEPPLADLFQVVVECTNEADQQTVFEQMTAAGYACTLLTL
jgi:ParB-like chromosome segregation protein Spo0J